MSRTTRTVAFAAGVLAALALPIAQGATAPTAKPAAADHLSRLDRYYGQHPVWRRCDTDAPAPYQCATITVPVDYEHPDGRTLRLQNSRLRTSTLGKRHGVLLSNPGGPGNPGLNNPAQLKDALAVVGDGVWRRSQSPEGAVTLVVREQVCPAGQLVLAVLHVVEAVLVGFPHIELRSGDRITVGISDGARDPTWLSRGTGGHVTPHRDLGGALDEERADDGGFGGARGGPMVDVDGLHGRAQDVRQQHELLAAVSGDVADRGEEVDGVLPFRFGQAGLPDERGQVAHQGLHQLFEPRILGVLE